MLLTDDENTPPLLPVPGLRFGDRFVDLHICFPDILDDSLTLFVNLLHGRFLLNDHSIEISEHLGQFLKVAFNLLDVCMSLSHES